MILKLLGLCRILEPDYLPRELEESYDRKMLDSLYARFVEENWVLSWD